MFENLVINCICGLRESFIKVRLVSVWLNRDYLIELNKKNNKINIMLIYEM